MRDWRTIASILHIFRFPCCFVRSSYFRLDEKRIIESEEVRPGIMLLDIDENDCVVGVGFLGVSSRATADELSTMQFQTA